MSSEAMPAIPDFLKLAQEGLKLSDGRHFIQVENERICSHKKADDDQLVDLDVVRQVEEDLKQLHAARKIMLNRIKVLQGEKPWTELAVPLKLEINP